MFSNPTKKLEPIKNVGASNVENKSRISLCIENQCSHQTWLQGAVIHNQVGWCPVVAVLCPYILIFHLRNGKAIKPVSLLPNNRNHRWHGNQVTAVKCGMEVSVVEPIMVRILMKRLLKLSSKFFSTYDAKNIFRSMHEHDSQINWTLTQSFCASKIIQGLKNKMQNSVKSNWLLRVHLTRRDMRSYTHLP